MNTPKLSKVVAMMCNGEAICLLYKKRGEKLWTIERRRSQGVERGGKNLNSTKRICGGLAVAWQMPPPVFKVITKTLA